jgi:hypothetical protein
LFLSGFGPILLVALQLKHLVADYYTQSTNMFLNKGAYGHPGGILHSGMHIAFTFLILMIFGVPLATNLLVCAVEFVLHYHIDWGKEAAGKRLKLSPDRAAFWRVHGSDQALHQLTYVGITWWVLNA